MVLAVMTRKTPACDGVVRGVLIRYFDNIFLGYWYFCGVSIFSKPQVFACPFFKVLIVLHHRNIWAISCLG